MHHALLFKKVKIYEEHTREEKNQAEMVVAPTTKFGTQKQKTQKHTTTDMSISTRHASKAPRGAKNYGNNGNRIKNTPVANNEESESSEDEDDTPNIIQANTSTGQFLMSSIGIGEYAMNMA